MRKKAAFLVVGLWLPCLGLGACSPALASSSSYPSALYYLFDTTISINLYDGTASVLAEIGDYLTGFSALTDGFTRPPSGATTLYTVNHTNAEITVPDELAQVLTFALTMQQATDGYLDPLIGNLAVDWKYALGFEDKTDFLESEDKTVAPSVLSPSVISADLAEMRSSTLTVVGDQVTRTGNATVDLGALAKGYALRKVQAILGEAGVNSYFVDAGSSSMIMGKKPSGDGTWRIGFNVGEGKANPAILTAIDTAMGTSSVTEQGAVIDGQTYSHLINPFTGSALASDVLASAVGADPGIDDAMSTCFFLMGETLAKTYAAKLGLGYCFYDGTTFSYSSNLEVTLNS
jgi:thiamine biosynthesis lipoprotein